MPGARLSLGILSRYPIKTTTYEQFPNPGLTAAGPDGRDWKLLDKGYVKAVIEAHDRYLGVLNAHCFPLHYFGAEPTEPRFTDMWRMLATDLLEMHDATPTLAGMDLNYAPIDDLLGELLRAGSYGNAFEGTPTTAKGIQQDYILYDRRMVLLQTTVSPTKSDHSYCQVEIVLP